MLNFTAVIFILLAMPFSALAEMSSGSNLPWAKIKVGKVILDVEVAKTPNHRQIGLMFRQKLEEGKGMLFIFDDESYRSFWMKNTFIPLSIAFFSKDKVLVDMQDMTPSTSVMQKQIPQYKSSKPATYALEVPRGWFRKVKINLGDRLEYPLQTRP
tara:strand:- start:19 stop:486 length:468 start_codon:yes stop_codon:yes gene_type:complete